MGTSTQIQMSILKPSTPDPWPWTPDPQTTFQTFDDYTIPLSDVKVTEDYMIEGKMLAVQQSVSMDDYIHREFSDVWKDSVREKLVYSLVRKMIELNLVEITKQDNPMDQTIGIRARCFLTTKEGVTLIRKASK